MIRTLPTMAIRQNLGELLNEVQYRHDSIVITRAGKPIAALVDVQLFEKIRLMKDQFEKMTTELGKIYQGTDVKIANDEISEAVSSVKHSKRVAKRKQK